MTVIIRKMMLIIIHIRSWAEMMNLDLLDKVSRNLINEGFFGGWIYM